MIPSRRRFSIFNDGKTLETSLLLRLLNLSSLSLRSFESFHFLRCLGSGPIKAGIALPCFPAWISCLINKMPAHTHTQTCAHTPFLSHNEPSDSSERVIMSQLPLVYNSVLCSVLNGDWHSFNPISHEWVGLMVRAGLWLAVYFTAISVSQMWR